MHKKEDQLMAKMRKSKPAYIASMIEKKIIAGEYKTGEALPSLQDLGNTYGVSPRTMREAFKNLEARGLISVSQGRKAVVRTSSIDMFVETLYESMQIKMKVDKKLLSDLLDVSINLSTSVSRNLSRNPDRLLIICPMKENLTTMEEAMKGVRNLENDSSINREELENRIEMFHQIFNNANYHFHLSLLHSNSNVIINTLIDNFADQLKLIYMKLEYSSDEMERTTKDYRYLIYALEHGHTDLAVALTLVDTTNLKNKFKKVEI